MQTKNSKGQTDGKGLFLVLIFFFFSFFLLFPQLLEEQERAGIVGGGEKRINEQPRLIFKTLQNTHVNVLYEHHFFCWVVYGIPKPTTIIPSKVLLNPHVSDMTLTSEGDKLGTS